MKHRLLTLIATLLTINCFGQLEIDSNYYCKRAIYLDCEHPISFKNCGIKDQNNQLPKIKEYKVKGGSYKKSEQNGDIYLIASSPLVYVDVIFENGKVWKEAFRVRIVPNPTIEIKDKKGKFIDLKGGIYLDNISSFKVDAVGDSMFCSILPKECIYSVDTVILTHARGMRPVNEKKFNSGDISTSEFIGPVKIGDRLIFEVKSFSRINRKGEKEQPKMGTQIFQLYIVEKPLTKEEKEELEKIRVLVNTVIEKNRKKIEKAWKDQPDSIKSRVCLCKAKYWPEVIFKHKDKNIIIEALEKGNYKILETTSVTEEQQNLFFDCFLNKTN